jgi:hypothetical protein
MTDAGSPSGRKPSRLACTYARATAIIPKESGSGP